MFNIHAATGPELVGDLAEVIAGEIENCAEGGITVEEVMRAKAQIKAGILMSLESSGARAEQLARQLLTRGRIIDPESVIARVEEQTTETLTAFARRLLSSGRRAVAVVGAGRDSVDLADSVHDRLAA